MSDQVERFDLRTNTERHREEMVADDLGGWVRYSDHRSVVERLEGERDLQKGRAEDNFKGSVELREALDRLEAERDQATSLIHKAIEEFEGRAERAEAEEEGPGGCEGDTSTKKTYREAASFLRDELSSPPEHQAEGRERQEKLAACDALDAAIQAAHQAAAEGKPPDAVARQAREAADEQRKRSLGIVG